MSINMALLYAGWALLWPFYTSDEHYYGPSYAGWALRWPFYTPDGHYYGPSIRRMSTTMALLYARWVLLWPFCTPDGYYYGPSLRHGGGLGERDSTSLLPDVFLNQI
jgi:hypothetical protein